MSRLLKGLSENTTTGFKFTAALILVALIPMALLGYISYRVIDARLVMMHSRKWISALKWHGQNTIYTGSRCATA